MAYSLGNGAWSWSLTREAIRGERTHINHHHYWHLINAQSFLDSLVTRIRNHVVRATFLKVPCLTRNPLTASCSDRAVGRSENPGVPVLFGSIICPPLVEIGLTDMLKSGGDMATPASLGTTRLQKLYCRGMHAEAHADISYPILGEEGAVTTWTAGGGGGGDETGESNVHGLLKKRVHGQLATHNAKLWRQSFWCWRREYGPLFSIVGSFSSSPVAPPFSPPSPLWLSAPGSITLLLSTTTAERHGARKGESRRYYRFNFFFYDLRK